MKMYEVGDRVTRQITIGKPERQPGTISEVYFASRSSSNPFRVTQYAVQWDDGTTSRGHLDVGLEREPIKLGGVSRVS